MKEKLEAIANKILNKTDIKPEQNYGSVLIILSVISIVLTLIRVIQECNKNELHGMSDPDDKCKLYSAEIKTLSFRKGLWTKMRIRKLIKKEFPPSLFEKYHLSLTNALINYGQNITDEDVKTLIEGLHYG